MKYITRKLTAFLLVAAMALFATAPVYAEEMFSGKRWCHMSYNQLGNPRVDLRISSSELSGGWANGQVFSTMMTNWANYSDNRVSVYSTNTNANIILVTISDWIYSPKILAFTTIYDKSNNAWNDGITLDSVSDSTFGSRIDHAVVRFNPNVDTSASVTNLTKTMTHEVGHCFNLGHPASSSSVTVMRQNWNLGWSNYDRPQAYDRTTIANMYTTIYS